MSLDIGATAGADDQREVRMWCQGWAVDRARTVGRYATPGVPAGMRCGAWKARLRHATAGLEGTQTAVRGD